MQNIPGADALERAALENAFAGRIIGKPGVRGKGVAMHAKIVEVKFGANRNLRDPSAHPAAACAGGGLKNPALKFAAEMQMRRGAVAAAADQSDLRAGTNDLPFFDGHAAA